jgi:hypothetical protein
MAAAIVVWRSRIAQERCGLRHSPAMSRIHPRAPEAKVFWFFSSEKNFFL